MRSWRHSSARAGGGIPGILLLGGWLQVSTLNFGSRAQNIGACLKKMAVVGVLGARGDVSQDAGCNPRFNNFNNSGALVQSRHCAPIYAYFSRSTTVTPEVSVEVAAFHLVNPDSTCCRGFADLCLTTPLQTLTSLIAFSSTCPKTAIASMPLWVVFSTAVYLATNCGD